jgi:predicted dehydrogenase/threonine dehydrogenase-like Zn-dependent dehydrogenase
MLAILANMKTGDVGTFEVPTPELRVGGLLVRTAFSAISAGTEINTIETGKKSLLGKAHARPDLVKQVVDFAKTNGIRAAYQKVRTRLDTVSGLGYSCSGIVLAVGEGVTEFQPGDRVACAGVGYASHSEINFVPRNLAAKIPDSVSLEAASLTTIGAIAIQGLRQAGVSLGENVVVVGAGLVGVLTVLLARAAGCRVIAIDANPLRAKQAVDFGASLVLSASEPSLSSKIIEFTKYGADAAIVTASSTSTEPIELSAQLLRDRGRIVVLGAVPLGVSRELMYRKELSLTLSRSYGPGRYDSNYEESGNDYPVGYVRWTEQRNMEAFLGFLATEGSRVDPLLRLQYRIEDGGRAYSEIQKSGAYTAVLKYDSDRSDCPVDHNDHGERDSIAAVREKTEVLRVGCVGAGSFARGIIFPQLQALKNVQLEVVGTASGASAFSAQKSFGFRRAQPPREILADPNVDAVFILSHHDSHAAHVLSALSRRKAVFVEKPLAVNAEEVESIHAAYRRELNHGRPPFVMVGFNRRFSPPALEIHRFFSGRRDPMLVHIRVNAGYLPREHWTQTSLNGGRIIGEACHFLDWMRYIVGTNIVSVYAKAIPDGALYNRDNVAMVVSFADGSVGNILYLANGDKSLPKEYYEVFCESAVARLDDYRSLELFRGGKRQHIKCDRDKGHKRELELTVNAMREGQPAPISFEELVEVSTASLAVVESLSLGMPVSLPAHRPTLATKQDAAASDITKETTASREQ